MHIHKPAFLAIALLAAPALCAEQEVKIPIPGNATLAGTLDLPASSDPAPALLLIAGSGPTDRNGSQPPTHMSEILKQFAQTLADHGIATLRVDKRGLHANAKQLPTDPAQLADFFSWQNCTSDVAAAYTFLRSQSHIDPTRVGILGHSEGGLFALQLAASLKSDPHRPAALILVSTCGRPFDQLLSEQVQALLKRQGATPDQAQYFTDQQNRVHTAIRDTSKIPADITPGLAGLYPPYIGDFYHGEFALDPAKLLADYPGPILILAGAADIQVPAATDAKLLDTAAASRKNDVHSFVLIPGASHNLKILKNAADPGITGPVAPAALDALTTWLATHLAK